MPPSKAMHIIPNQVEIGPGLAAKKKDTFKIRTAKEKKKFKIKKSSKGSHF